jgi:hypothetical protein
MRRRVVLTLAAVMLSISGAAVGVSVSATVKPTRVADTTTLVITGPTSSRLGG